MYLWKLNPERFEEVHSLELDISFSLIDEKVEDGILFCTIKEEHAGHITYTHKLILAEEDGLSVALKLQDLLHREKVDGKWAYFRPKVKERE